MRTAAEECSFKQSMIAQTTPPEVIYWDWKGSIDIDHLNDALKSGFDGKNLPRIYNVDTGQDCYGVVVSSGVMTPENMITNAKVTS